MIELGPERLRTVELTALAVYVTLLAAATCSDLLGGRMLSALF